MDHQLGRSTACESEMGPYSGPCPYESSSLLLQLCSHTWYDLYELQHSVTPVYMRHRLTPSSACRGPGKHRGMDGSKRLELQATTSDTMALMRWAGR